MPHLTLLGFSLISFSRATSPRWSSLSPDYNPLEYVCDELGHAITNMDSSPQNLGELRYALLDKWAAIPVECPQYRVANMPRSLAAIITARGGNTWYLPGIHKTTPTGNIMQKSVFGQIYMWPISTISINAITNLLKYTLNKIIHTIYRKIINSASQPAFSPHKQNMNNRQKVTLF